VLEGERNQPLTLAEQDQQQVLAVQRVVPKLQEEILGPTERLTRLFGELLNGNHDVNASHDGAGAQRAAPSRRPTLLAAL